MLAHARLQQCDIAGFGRRRHISFRSAAAKRACHAGKLAGFVRFGPDLHVESYFGVKPTITRYPLIRPPAVRSTAWARRFA